MSSFLIKFYYFRAVCLVPVTLTLFLMIIYCLVQFADKCQFVSSGSGHVLYYVIGWPFKLLIFFLQVKLYNCCFNLNRNVNKVPQTGIKRLVLHTWHQNPLFDVNEVLITFKSCSLFLNQNKDMVELIKVAILIKETLQY